MVRSRRTRKPATTAGATPRSRPGEGGLGAALFPPIVAFECVRFRAGDEPRFAAVVVPGQLARAVPKRRLDFLAGRFCARRALARLTRGRADEPIAIGANHEPVWPTGFVGAITHTEGFAAAVVARAAESAGVGLDSERVISDRTMGAVVDDVATRGEIEALAGTGLDDAVLLTLVFSAKESLYKCLYRHVGRYFDFHDAAIVAIGERRGTFTVELAVDLGGFAAGSQLEGRFAVVDGLVHTGLTLPR